MHFNLIQSLSLFSILSDITPCVPQYVIVVCIQLTGVWILKAAKMMPNVEFKFLSQIVNLLHVEYVTSKNVLPEEDIHL